MRWKAFIPTVVIVALIAIFTIFFMDGLIKRGIEKAGTAANGAKVELDSVRTSIIHLTLTLNHLQVTDENVPMTNSIEVERMQFHLAPKPLTWKKIVIENAEIAGIRTGTPRKYSGAIPKKQEEKAKPQEPSKVAELTGSAVGNLKEAYDPKKLVSVDNLASYKKIQEEQTHFTELSKDWQTKVDSIKVEDKAKEAQDFANQVKGQNFSGVEGLKKAKDTLQQASKIKNDFEQTQKSFNAMKNSLQTEISQSKNALKQIDDLRKQDMENAVAKVKSGFSAEGLTRGLLGPEWNGKLQTGLAWFHKIKNMIPQKKPGEKEPPPPPRSKGKDISFPFHYAWPTFLLKHAALSGVTSGAHPLDYKGTLTNVSSDPKIVGQPIGLDVAGKSAAGPEALTLHGEFDFTKDVAREAIKLKYSGLSLDGTKLGDVSGPVSIKSGLGNIAADLGVTGDKIAGTVNFNAAPVKLEHTVAPDKAADRLASILHDVLSRVNALNINVIVSDTITSPNLKIKTNIDNQLNDAVKQVLQKQLDEVKAQVQQRVDELTKGERQKLQDLVNSRTSGVTDKLNQKDGALKSAQDQINKVMDDLKKKAAGSVPIPALGGGNGGDSSKPAVPDLKKLFKKR